MQRAIAAGVGAFLWLTSGIAAQGFVEGIEAAQAKIDAKEWDAALELLLPLQGQIELDEDVESLAGRLSQVGYALIGGARFAAGLKACEATLALRRRLHGERDDADVATSLNDVAYCLGSLGRKADSLARHEQALAMRRRLFGGDHPDIATSLTNIAGCLVALGRGKEALSRYEEALDLTKRRHGDADHQDVALGLNNVAGCRHALGDVDAALPLFEQALAMRRRLFGEGDHPHLATNLNNVAACLATLGRASEAIAYYEQALAMQSRLLGEGDHSDVAASLNNVASCLRSLGRASEALPRYEESLAMQLRLYGDRDHPGVATSMNNLAICLKALGRVDEALSLHEQALAMRDRLHGGRDHPFTAQSLNNRASCLEVLGRAGDALPAYERALAMRKRLFGEADHPDVAESVHNVGICLKGLGRASEALPLLEQASECRRRLYHDADHPLVAQSLDSTALCLSLLGRVRDALPLFEGALAMQKRLYGDRDHPDVARVLNNLAGCLVQLRRPKDALAACQDAVAMIERLRGASRTSAALRQSFFDELKRGWAFERLQLVAAGLAMPKEAMLAAERGRSRGLLDLLEQQGIDPIEEAERRTLSAGDVVGGERLARLRSDLEQARLESDRLLHQMTRLDSNTRTAASDSRRASLLEQSNEVARRIRRLCDEQARSAEDVAGRVCSVAEIQAVLGTDELFLEFTLTDGAALLYVLSHEGEVQVESLPATCAATCASVAETPGRGPIAEPGDVRGRDPDATSMVEARSRSRSMFTELFPTRVWERVRTSRRVFVAAHQALHRVAFEAMVVDEKDGKPIYWIDRGPPIAYVPSGSALRWLRKRKPDARHMPLDLVVVGDPQLADRATGVASGETDAMRVVHQDDLERLHRLPQLKGARAEAEAIAAAFRGREAKADLLLGERATEPAVFELGAKAKYLHFACHGIAEEYAGQSLSMLVLTQPKDLQPGDDGFLKFTDLLQNWRGRLDGCRLVTLSACRTNVGPTLRDEAPQALPIGFLLAGAPAVISSLWAVDDASTKELMTDFYGRLVGGETDQLAALTAAKKELRAKYPDPFHWAPFLYLGAPE